MTSKRPSVDAAARRRIEAALDRNLVVEAAAGTGKTASLVDRMVAMIRDGTTSIERLSAVTFTIKAAAHLSERFQLALESGRETEKDPAKRERLEAAIAGLDRCFVGTIHAFCARLLRERPVEAGVDPEFQELDETENVIARDEAWDSYVQRLFAEESPILSELSALGIALDSLKETYRVLADNTDVEPERTAPGKPPDWVPVQRALEVFLQSAAAELPPSPPAAGWDSFQRRLREALRLQRHVDPSRPATLVRVLECLDHTPRVVQNRWPRGHRAKALAHEFDLLRASLLGPALTAWREFLYPIVIDAIVPAVAEFRSRRLAAGRLNFQDLLLFARDLLRDHSSARRDFQDRFTPILVDEFQDTDPIQAEVLLYLTGRDAAEKDWRRLDPVPGSLFVVGDPKQSIYRFRRADIETYERVRERIVASGGEVVALTSNFRSTEPLCGWINQVFAPLFPASATREQAAYSPLSAARDRAPGGLTGAFRLEVPALARSKEIASADAEQIARWVRSALDGATLPLEKGARGASEPGRVCEPGDFMILLRYRGHLRLYARALEARRIPYEISGGGAFADSEDLAALLSFLQALIEPDDPRHFVAALRGDLFGVDDRALYEFRRTGGRFSLLAEPPVDADPRINRAFRILRESREWIRHLPPAAALARILDRLGLVAAAAAEELGETNAGNLLKAMTLVRQLSSEGQAFSAIVRHLRELSDNKSTDIEEMSSQPGRAGVVRLMNLHRAKGLEAPIVFLADPTREPPNRNITWSVDRREDPPRGFFRMSVPRGPFEAVDIARPPGWESMAEREAKFYEAESDRLLYVAATRAQDLLVVSVQIKDGAPVTAKNPWGKLVAHVPSKLPPLAPPLDTPRIGRWDTMRSERQAASEHRESRLAAAASSTYDVTHVTAVGHAALAKPFRTSTGRGFSWGRVLHRLLEAMMKDESLDVRAYAANVLVEEERPPEEGDEVARLAEAVTRSSLWQRARASRRRFVEVPFGLMVPTEELATGGPHAETLLQGAIDLVFEEDGGWVVVDYKSDTVSGNLAELSDFYRPQIAHYRRYWQKLTGRPTKAVLYFIETHDEVWLEDQ